MIEINWTNFNWWQESKRKPISHFKFPKCWCFPVRKKTLLCRFAGDRSFIFSIYLLWQINLLTYLYRQQYRSYYGCVVPDPRCWKMRGLRDLLPSWMWWGTTALNVLKYPGFPTLRCYLFMQMVVATACSVFAVLWLVFSCAINKSPEPLSEMTTLLSLSSREVYLAAGFQQTKMWNQYPENNLPTCPYEIFVFFHASSNRLNDFSNMLGFSALYGNVSTSQLPAHLRRSLKVTTGLTEELQ